MKKIIEQIIIPLDGDALFSPQRIKISVRDEAAGYFLAIEGVNDEASEEESSHEFYLCSVGEIDDFAKICKELITQGEKSK